jgi:hypothetical protein
MNLHTDGSTEPYMLACHRGVRRRDAPRDARRDEHGDLLHVRAEIALRVGGVLNRREVAKHFRIDIREDRFSYHRNQDSITVEAALHGIYVLRTCVEPGYLEPGEVVSSYKALAQVKRPSAPSIPTWTSAPSGHRTEDQVRAHVFLRMLSYYISWHMQARLAPLPFTDADKPAARAARQSAAAPAALSPKALAKATAKHTD